MMNQKDFYIAIAIAICLFFAHSKLVFYQIMTAKKTEKDIIVKSVSYDDLLLVDTKLQEMIAYNESRLAELLYFECGYSFCSSEERNLILDVVFWRLKTEYRGAKTIKDVIESPKQFSYLNGVESRERIPMPQNAIDRYELDKIERQVAMTYSNFIFENEDAMSYQTMQKKVLMYYNPKKVKKTPSWVDESCRVDVPEYFLHRFYSCYKLK